MAAAPAATFLKDPSAVLDYGLDWSDWLKPGEILTASTWTVPGGITKNSDTFTRGGLALIWLSTGVDGTTYDIVNQVVSSGGRTDERTLRINVVNR